MMLPFSTLFVHPLHCITLFPRPDKITHKLDVILFRKGKVHVKEGESAKFHRLCCEKLGTKQQPCDDLPGRWISKMYHDKETLWTGCNEKSIYLIRN